MKTQLIEFTGPQNYLLRGILTLPDTKPTAGVICLHGFERTASTEIKFKSLADKLATNQVATFRLDFSGCGISDGDFRFTTSEAQGEEFVIAQRLFQEKLGLSQTHVIAHSLGACALAIKLDGVKDAILKILLIAPALNQKELLRYRFVVNQIKRSNPSLTITWGNYKHYLNNVVS